MNERLVFIPFQWDGTASASGSAVYVTKVPLKFHSGGIYAAAPTGGSVAVTYAGIAQGTATLKTESAAGSCYIGTVATGWGTQLRVPENGTVVIYGTAAAAGYLQGYAAFLIDEFGGTVYA
jgi:hypothetical protein